jgi:hypothetical protein
MNEVLSQPNDAGSKCQKLLTEFAAVLASFVLVE